MRYLSDYLDYILETVKSNTAQLYYSEKFRSLLKKIENKSEVAKLLLQAERSNQVLTQYTLIDITDKNDTVSFVQINRILRKYPEMEVDKELFTKGDYIEMPGTEFWKESRTEMNIGRWSRRTFSEAGKSIPDSDIEQFVNLYKATFDNKDEDNSNLQLLSGEDIRHWYLEDNYESRKSQLGASCMRYKFCQPYLDIYVKNPKVCQILILKSDDGKISGRALIWKLYHHKEGRQFYKGDYYMDRIYTNNDSDKILFQEWADKKGMRYYGQSKTDWIMYVKLDSNDFEYYPYMDTFMCYNNESLLLCNDESLWPDGGYIKIQETDGGYISNDVVWSEWYSEYITKDSAVFCENVKDFLYRDDAKYLEYKDEYAAPTDDVVYSEYHEENFFSEDAIYSDMLGDWLYPKDKSVIRVKISNDDIDHCVKSRADLYIEIDGKYYSRKSYIKDPLTDEYHFLNDGDYVDDLYDRLEKELIDKEKRGLDYRIIVRPIVVEQIRTINREGKFNKEDVIREIESNDMFIKQLRSVYWGVAKDKTPEAEDIIPALFAWMVEKNKFNTNIRVSNLVLSGFTDSIKTFCVSDGKIDEELQKKYHIWFGTDSRMIRIISKVCDSFNYELFGKEVYKRYVFLNLP
jgi:hypothetical protein